MQVFLVDARTGVEDVVDIGVDDTAETLRAAAMKTFPYPPATEADDLHLSVGGKEVCGDDPLSSTASVEAGCRVDVDLVRQEHLEALRTGRKLACEVPVWVSTREQALSCLVPSKAHRTWMADRDFVLAAQERHDEEYESPCREPRPKRRYYDSSDSEPDPYDTYESVESEHPDNIFNYVHESLKSDHEIVLAAVANDPDALNNADISLKSDPVFIIELLEQNFDHRSFAADSMWADKSVMLAAVKRCPVRKGDLWDLKMLLRESPSSIKADPDVILAAVRRGGSAVLKFAHGSLIFYRNHVAEILKSCPDAFAYADDSLMGDRDAVLTALQRCSPQFAERIFGRVHDSLKADRLFVIGLVTKDPKYLSCIHASLKDDRDVMLAFVQACGMTSRDKELLATILREAPATLRADRDIILTAVSKNPKTLQFAHDSLKADREVILTAVSKNPYALSSIDDSFKGDREIILTAVRKSAYALRHADDTLKADREVVLTAVSKNPNALQFADDTLKADRDLALNAVQTDGCALQHVHDTLKADREVVLTAVKEKPAMLKYAHASLKTDPEVVRAARHKRRRCAP